MFIYDYCCEFFVVKIINYVMGICIQKWLKENGVDVVLYYDNDMIKELDCLNFFLIDLLGKMIIFKDDVFFGIIRMKVIEVV